MKIPANGVCMPAGHPASRREIMIAIPTGLMAGAVMALQAFAAQDSKATITIDNFTFAPAELTVPVGSVVTWINRDDIPHTIVENNKTFRTKALDTEDSYSFTFTTAGTFNYICGLHPFMMGKVIVKP
ncbi:amicyanin [Nitrobacteraceae bacterium AZCC 1564]